MNMFQAIGDFFLSAWLWHRTFDWFHPVIAGIVMFFMLRIVLRRKRVPSLCIALGAQLFAFLALDLLVTYFLIEALNWTFEPLSDPRYAFAIVQMLYGSLSVGLIYAFFQSLYFLGGRLFLHYNAIAFCMVAWISNGIGMLISYLFIRMFVLWQYKN